MTPLDSDPLVAGYLSRLAHSAAGLAPDRREELVAEIREHIEAALTVEDAPVTEARVRTVLDRLGSPEEIVAAAGGGEAVATAPLYAPLGPPRRPGIGLEILAVLLLVTGFPPILGWLVGAVLLWSSRRWTLSDKLLGTLVVPGGLMTLGAFGVLGASQTCTGGSVTGPDGTTQQLPEQCTGTAAPAWLGVPLLVLLVVAPLVVGAYLLSRARRAADSETWPQAGGGPGPARRWTSRDVAGLALLAGGALVLPLAAVFFLVGALVPLVAYVAGAVLVWASSSWSTQHKVVGTVLLPLAPLLVAGLVAFLLVTRGGVS